MADSVFKTVSFVGGNYVFDGDGEGEVVGTPMIFPFAPIASVGAGEALTTIAARVFVPFRHRLKAAVVGASAVTAVSGGTDPAVAVYRHLPVPPAPTLAMISPAAAGNVETGVHYYAICNLNAAGTSMPSAWAAITVADKTANGKVVLTFPVGPSGTTSRKIYRTAAAGTDLKLLATISNNTATTYTDNTADGSLGADAPTADASGVTVCAATLKLSPVTGPELVDQPLLITLADAVETVEWDACVYTLRVLTGASTGAISNLTAHLRLERVAE